MNTTRKNSGLAIICSLFLLLSLFINGIFISLKMGVFSGTGTLALENNSAFKDAITESLARESSDVLDEYGFSEDTFSELMDDDYINKVISVTSDSLLDTDKPADLSSLKGDTVEFCNNTSEMIVDDYVDNLDQSNGKLSKTTVLDNPIANAMSENYGINLDTEIENTIKEKYPNVDTDKEIDLSTIDKDELKTTLNTAVNDKIKPQLDTLTDRFISIAEENIDKASSSIDPDTLSTYKNISKIFNGNINVIIAVLSIISIFFFLVQFAFYGAKYRNRPFTNLAIVSFFASLPLLLIGSFTKIFSNQFDSVVDRVSSSRSYVSTLITDLSKNWLSPFLKVGFVMLAICVISSIISIISKSLRSE